MNIFSSLKQNFNSGSSVIRLIYINIGIFVVFYLFQLILTLFDIPLFQLSSFISVPSNLQQLLVKPWTLISYMFFHENFFHILFNMFALYWFGKLFLIYFNEKQLTALYVIGGLAGAAVFILSFNIFPFFIHHFPQTVLLGASGSIMAIITAVAFQVPDLEMQMMFIGRIKLKWIAVFFILTSFFGITSNNAGGELAHLGGALTGYLFVVSLHKGKDFTKGLNRFIDVIYSLFGRKKLRVVKNQKGKKMTDADFNRQKARNMEEIDRILDKIKKSGYDSLSNDEKRKLFEQKK